MAKRNNPTTRPVVPSAAHLLAEIDSPKTTTDGTAPTVKVEGNVLAMAAEEGDAPIGLLTDAQVGNRIRLICARGYAALVFPVGGQIYLRVVRPD